MLFSLFLGFVVDRHALRLAADPPVPTGLARGADRRPGPRRRHRRAPGRGRRHLGVAGSHLRPGRPHRERHLALRHRRLDHRARRVPRSTPWSRSCAAERSASRSHRSAVDGADPPHRSRGRRRDPGADGAAATDARLGKTARAGSRPWPCSSWSCSAGASCWSTPSAAPRPSTATSTRRSPRRTRSAPSASGSRAPSSRAPTCAPATASTFMITFNGVEIPVQHHGDPPEMFKADEAVLLEGHFADDGSEHLRLRSHDREAQQRLREQEPGAAQGGRRGRAGPRQPQRHRPRPPRRERRPRPRRGHPRAGRRHPRRHHHRLRPDQEEARDGPPLALVRRRSCFLGGLLAFVAMERALITRDFTVKYVYDNGSVEDAGALQLRHPVGGSRGLDHPLGHDPRRLPRGRGREVPQAPRGPARRLGRAHHARGGGVLLLPPRRAGQPVQERLAGSGLRRPRPQPAAAEPPADGVPPARALPRLRRVHGARSPSPSPRSSPVGWGRGGCSPPAAGPSSPGASSPSASCSGRGGATRSSAGVATGPGTRSRTPRSCPGSPAPPTCTR